MFLLRSEVLVETKMEVRSVKVDGAEEVIEEVEEG